MSVPITNNLMQQNIVINQVPMQHTLMTNVNANNGIPMGAAMHHTNSNMDHSGEMKTGMIVDSMPLTQANLMGVQSIPIQNANPTKIIHNHNNLHLHQNSEHTQQVLTKQRLQDLVRDTDPTLTLEEEVEEIILNYVDEFIDRCMNGAALIAKNRKINTVEVKDVQQFLNRNYNMWTPGFGTDELRPYKRSLMTEAHKQRSALIRKALKKY